MRWPVLGFLLLLWLPRGAAASDDATLAAGIEFYEKRIRPLLLENCQKCHGPEKQRGGLRVDDVAALKKGGDRGPAIVPKDVAKSLLLHATKYEDAELRMPPKGKLAPEELEALNKWVQMGAPAPGGKAVGAANAFDLAERLKHWCYQPVQSPQPPTVRDRSWSKDPIDHFVLRRLEDEGLQPAAAASKRAWLRRVTFSLIGLPPSLEEQRAFLEDASPDAKVKVVDRLLASPHYGERWGRHWLDLVRYAETLGHEFDFDLPNAWRYRDYVIRAFNDDLPYDQFVVEQIAGDLLPQPRRHPTEGRNESLTATGFWWLGEAKQAPVDVRQEQADRIDNQIDVFSKTFMGQTLVCARCHDHKFDALSTRDYYALYGFLKSSRYQQGFIDAPERTVQPLARVRETRDALGDRLLGALQEGAKDVDKHLVAAAKDGEAGQAEGWRKLLRNEATKDWSNPLALLARTATNPALQQPEAFKEQWVTWQREVAVRDAQYKKAEADLPAFGDLKGPGFGDWQATGMAFGAGAVAAGELFLLEDENALRPRFLPGTGWHSGLLTPTAEGVVRSPTFTISKKYLHFLTAGRGSRISVIIDGFTLIRDPIYGGLAFDVNDDKLQWRIVNVGHWLGHRAYVELLDDRTPHPAMSPPAAKPNHKGGYLHVAAIRQGDGHQPLPQSVHPLLRDLLKSQDVTTLDDLANKYAASLNTTLTALQKAEDERKLPDGSVDLVNLCLELGLVDLAGESWQVPAKAWKEATAAFPVAQRAPATADGTGEDERVFLRGSHKTPGEVARRGLPEAWLRSPNASDPKGSGRLELARRLVSPDNPLLARVLVNRIWHHHFGRGLVPTTDDFGRMGQEPSHPELLDYLATTFVREGWSIKKLQRHIVLSSTYATSGQRDAAAMQKDPRNLSLHYFPMRRLDAEAIRDSMLAVAGKLHRKQFGPGVAPHLTAFMEGRGRPGQSGPVDGEGRRSIYLGVRRNFLNPMFLAFDYPVPFSTMGRRTSSNVPAQALTLLNDPFVVQMARHWAEKTLQLPGKDAGERIDVLYEEAFARPPTDAERTSALQFLEEQAARLGKSTDDVATWTDLCHVLFNVKEFTYLE